MTKLLSCREVGCYDYCDYIVTGETEEDIVRSAAEHDIKEHDKTNKYIVKLKEKLKGFIHTNILLNVSSTAFNTVNRNHSIYCPYLNYAIYCSIKC
jgi:predicted small metal-binding protein